MAESGEALRCTRENHSGDRLQEDYLTTETSIEQKKVESSVDAIFTAIKDSHGAFQLVLERELHAHYLRKGLQHLSDSYECLDASRPWLCYWIVHSLMLLDEPIPKSVASSVCQFLGRCQAPSGGFGGGPGQQPHLAPTYAAVNALCTIGTEEAYNIINREKLLEFLWSLKQPDGSFNMHVGGEVDVRSAYCAASVASLTNIMTPKLFDGSAEWIARCQFWEGGIGGVPGMEAHGGYTFCGLAALVILKRVHLLDLKSLLILDPWMPCLFETCDPVFQSSRDTFIDEDPVKSTCYLSKRKYRRLPGFRHGLLGCVRPCTRNLYWLRRKFSGGSLMAVVYPKD